MTLWSSGENNGLFLAMYSAYMELMDQSYSKDRSLQQWIDKVKRPWSGINPKSTGSQLRHTIE